MSSHPVRMVVRDARLERSRPKVFFRLVLLVPHLIWLTIWSVITLVVVVVNWLVVLVTGRSPDGLHGFIASYLRYWLHVNVYAALMTDLYPRFGGEEGIYPFDVEIAPPQPQSRVTVLVRLFLAIPALLLAWALAGGGVLGGVVGSRSRSNSGGGTSVSANGVLATVAVLSWFACVVRGRQPEGMRNLGAYALRYSVQAYSYLFLLTDRYPDAAPADRATVLATPGHPVSITCDDDGRRSRLTVFFRLPLTIPHLVWLALWGIAAILAAIAAWVAGVFTGRVPVALHRFLAAYIRYAIHVYAFFSIVANPFPGFTGAPGTYPVDAALPAEPVTQPRLTILVRAILAIPALMLASATATILWVSALLLWFAGLFLGRAPASLVTAGAFALRYSAQANAYVLLVTPRYPYSGPWSGDEPDAPAPQPPLVPTPLPTPYA